MLAGLSRAYSKGSFSSPAQSNPGRLPPFLSLVCVALLSFCLGRLSLIKRSTTESESDSPAADDTDLSAGGSNHYNANYFLWQREFGGFGALVDTWKFEEFVGPNLGCVDLGSGGGYMLSALNCKSKVGIEVNPAARQHSSAVTGVTTVASAESLPDGSADVIISHHSLEHMHNPLQVLKTLRRKLKIGGTFVAVVPHDEVGLDFLPDDPHHHLYTWTAALLGNLFQEAGYDVVQAEEYPYLWVGGLPNRGLLEQFGIERYHRMCRDEAEKSGVFEVRVVATRGQ